MTVYVVVKQEQHGEEREVIAVHATLGTAKARVHKHWADYLEGVFGRPVSHRPLEEFGTSEDDASWAYHAKNGLYVYVIEAFEVQP